MLVLVLLSVAVVSLPSLVSSQNGEVYPVDAAVQRWFTLGIWTFFCELESLAVVSDGWGFRRMLRHFSHSVHSDVECQ